MTTPHLLARLMCEATEQLLWQVDQAHLRKTRSQLRLDCRAGRGRATHHRAHHPDEHQITYGIGMVSSKLDPAQRITWLSAREIQRRPYFAGHLGLASVLAHTCCHEYAHFLQSLAGERRRGEVHNAAFYRHLDSLHQDGRAQAIRTHLLQRAEGLRIALDDQPPRLPATPARERWQPGEVVRFGRPGGPQHEGRIVRVNRLTCTVEGTGKDAGLRFRVGFGALR